MDELTGASQSFLSRNASLLFNLVKTILSVCFDVSLAFITVILNMFGIKDNAAPIAKLLTYFSMTVVLLALLKVLSQQL